MTDLADALDRTGECELVRFRITNDRAIERRDASVAARSLVAALAPQSRTLDRRLLPRVDVVHVAGLATPPTKSLPLIVSVDDLRPLRGETRNAPAHHPTAPGRRRTARFSWRRVALRVTRSSSVLGVARSQVVVVPPAVPHVDADRRRPRPRGQRHRCRPTLHRARTTTCRFRASDTVRAGRRAREHRRRARRSARAAWP